MKIKSKSVIQYDIPDKNGRVYSKDAMEKAIEQYNEKVENGRAVGTIGSNLIIDIKQISHKIEKIESNDENGYNIEALILETPNGKLLKELIKSGHKIEPNMVSMGTVDKNGVVQEMEIQSINLCLKEGNDENIEK